MQKRPVSKHIKAAGVRENEVKGIIRVGKNLDKHIIIRKSEVQDFIWVREKLGLGYYLG